MPSDDTGLDPSGSEPQLIVRHWDDCAIHRETPCGDGRLVWRIWGAGPPLVLLHGGAGSWTHWIRNIPSFTGRFTVIAPDLPGLGDSDMLPPPHSAEGLAAVISHGLDELLPASGFHLAGFSFGGVLACHVAAQLGARIRSLVIIGAGGLGLPHGDIPRPRKPLPEMAANELAKVHRHNLACLMFGDPAKIDALAVHVQAENTRRARFRERAIAESDTLRHAIPAVRTSLLAIYGSRDVYAAPFIAERRELLRELQPASRFEVVENAGHWVPYETARRLNEMLRQAISR